MNFATYGRKSVYSDKSDSVDNQQRMCREYVDLRFNGQVDTFECYSDEGFTGANTDRPGLQRLLQDVEDGLVDALIVYQLDRLSRNVKDFANIYYILEQKDVKFISIKENIDTNTPIGKAMMMVSMVFAQMERETIAQRVTDNMIGLAKKGFWVGGNPPYGYEKRQVVIGEKKHWGIFPVPEAAKYVESIFDLFLENEYSLQRMETAFKNQGIKTRNGGFFSANQLYAILTMPYCVPATPEVWDYFSDKGCVMANERSEWDGRFGVMVYGRSTKRRHKTEKQPPTKWIVCKGIHEPFMSPEKWLSAQRQMTHNTFFKKGKYDRPLLKGVLRCARCGNKMAVARKKLVHGTSESYYCYTRTKKGLEYCDMPSIKCSILDEKAMEVFAEIETDKSAIKKYTSRGIDSATSNSILTELEKEAASIRRRIARLTDSLADGSVASKYIIPQIEKEDLSLSAINRSIEVEKSRMRKEQNEITSAEEHASMITKMMRLFDTMTPNEKNEIVNSAISRCTWDGERLFLLL